MMRRNGNKGIRGKFRVKYTLAFLLLFFSGVSVFGMDAKEILRKMGEVYEKTSVYEFHMKYELFKGEKGTTVETTYAGYFMRNKTKVYQKIDQTEFITTPDFCMKISHTEKIAELMKGETYKNQDIDFEKTIKECKEIKMEEEDTYYLITMVIKNASQVPFSKVKVKVNKSNFHLSQLDLYYSHLEDFSENPQKKDLHQPHVRVSYSKFSKKPSVTDGVFNYGMYVKTVNNMVSLTGTIKNYELIDQRIN